MNEETIKIMIVDDHPLFRSALNEALELSLENVHCTQSASLLELENNLAKDELPHLLLLDLQMPDSNGFSGLVHLRSHYPNLPIILISAHDSQDVMQQAENSGAKGFISKSESITDIRLAILTVLDGGQHFPALNLSNEGGAEHTRVDLLEKISSLTPKQYAVFHHCSQGLLNKQIAYELSVTEATVKAHITSIMRKLDINNRTQIVIISNKVKDDLKLNYHHT